MTSLTETEPEHISNSMLTVWYEALLNRYNTIKESTNAIDNKTSIILAACIAVLIFGVSSSDLIAKPLGIIGVVGIVISIILSLININLKQTPAEVNSSEDRPEYYKKTDDGFIWQLISDIELAISILTVSNQRKAKLYRWLTGLFAISTIVLLSANYIQIEIIIK